MREPTERLIRAIDYEFRDNSLIETALTHRSVGKDNNERLEFLGDAILGFIIADELFSQFPEANEGELSRLRARLVKRDSLAKLARIIDLGKYLCLGTGELRSGGYSRSSILADALEALFAAVYLDGGYSEARRIILKLFKAELASLNEESQSKDPKTCLQELLQARKLQLPNYSIIDVSGEQHEQQFTVRCLVEGLEIETIGTGESRRKAEQDAAYRLLGQIQNG
ncbi:MAG: ribonuclease III [Sedimenticola sp.]